MTPERWQQVKEIFDAAKGLAPEGRSAFLDYACARDEALRREVESLLVAHDESSDFMDSPAVNNILAERPRLSAGQRVGPFEVISLLGAGGMGEVYLANDTRLGRKAAVKLLPSHLTDDAERVRRFSLEARTASALNHPNLLTIYEVGQSEGRHYIATEFVEGETLRARLEREGRLRVGEALDVAAQVAAALVAAHAAGVVHRDVKPENVMVRPDGLVKLLDFGLAKLAEGVQSIPSDSGAPTKPLARTAPGLVMGTVRYMSPEQARGLQVDARTDVWSLGCVLYEMLTGRAPFDGESTADVLISIIQSEPPPIPVVPESVSDEVNEFVGKALRKNREARYQSSEELLADLRRLRRRLEPGEPTELSTSPRRKKSAFHNKRGERAPGQRRSPARYALPVVLLVLATAGAGVYWYSTGRSAIRSVAVLPLANVNSDPDAEYLSDGITDNIIERLSQLPDLKVMSHKAVFRYKGRETDPLTVGRELGVEAVLSGRVVKRGDALTISLELADARDNSHVWGGQYDRKLSDLMAVQREIPVDIAEKLRLRLGSGSRERLARAHTGDAEAYQLYLKGRYSWQKWTTDGAKQAVGYFEEAIRKDPNYALAYAGLADAYIFGAGVGPEAPQKEAHRRAREAATKALSLDLELGEAHAALAGVLLYDDWDFAGAEREYERAIELSPSYAEAHHGYSHLLLLLGRIEESFAESQKLLELDPVSETPIGHLGYHYIVARQYDEAIEQLQKALRLYPDAAEHTKLGDAYYQKGMFSEAVEEYLKGFAQERGFPPDKLAELREAFAESGIKGFQQNLIGQLKAGPQTEQDHVMLAKLYAQLGEKDQAFEWLERAYAEHAAGLVRLKEEVGFDNLRSDPRFADLVRRVGLPQ